MLRIYSFVAAHILSDPDAGTSSHRGLGRRPLAFTDPCGTGGILSGRRAWSN